MIKAVFMDIDNTILDYSAFVSQTIKEGFVKYGLPSYSDDLILLNNKINNQLWRRLEQKEITFQELSTMHWNLFFQELGITFNSRLFQSFYNKSLCQSAIFEPHALELIRYLKKKYVLCAASNAPYEQQMNRLKVGGIAPLFSYIFISSAIGAMKPEQAFFDCCFGELRKNEWENLKPEEAIIIGDTLSSDIIGGKNYGMKTCYYTRGQECDVNYEEADYIVSDLIEIMQIL